MTTDGIVQKTETASTTEQVSTGATQKTEVKTEQTPQPLTAEQVQKMIADETEKVRRQIQSDKDKAIAEVRREAERRVREAEIEKQSTEAILGELDEDSKVKIELARYKAKDRYAQDYQREEQLRIRDAQSREAFVATVQDLASSLDIDPKEIEWGDGREDLNTKFARISKQLTMYHKSRRQAEKESIPRLVAEAVAKKYRELGIDSVDTSVSVTNREEFAGIPTKVDEFRQWIAKMPQKEYEAKYADKVNKMRREGLIK